MKLYITPEIEALRFEVGDVITESLGGPIFTDPDPQPTEDPGDWSLLP